MQSYFPLVPCVIRRRTSLCAELLLPDCARFSCCSPLASASAAAPGPDCGIRFQCSPFASASSCCSPIVPASAAAHRLRPLQLLLPIASSSAATPRLRPLQLLLPDCVAPTAAPRLRPLQLLLARLRPLQLLLPDCVRFNCCSPDCRRLLGPMFSNILRLEFEVQ